MIQKVRVFLRRVLDAAKHFFQMYKYNLGK